MGGPVPLGYDVVERKLIPNEQEAKTVRYIMQRYIELGSVKSLVADLDAQGYRTKVQIRTSTANKGGYQFRRGTLYHLLSNRIYTGDIVHKGTSYPGEHDAIVPQALWDRVQAALADRSQGGTSRHGAKYPSLLVGMVRDGEGGDMTPSHTNRGNRRYRYYVTRPEQVDAKPAWRVNAHDLEHLMSGTIAELLIDEARLLDIIGNQLPDATTISEMFNEARFAATKLTDDATGARKDIQEQRPAAVSGCS